MAKFRYQSRKPPACRSFSQTQRGESAGEGKDMPDDRNESTLCSSHLSISNGQPGSSSLLVPPADTSILGYHMLIPPLTRLQVEDEEVRDVWLQVVRDREIDHHLALHSEEYCREEGGGTTALHVRVGKALVCRCAMFSPGSMHACPPSTPLRMVPRPQKSARRITLLPHDGVMLDWNRKVWSEVGGIGSRNIERRRFQDSDTWETAGISEVELGLEPCKCKSLDNVESTRYIEPGMAVVEPGMRSSLWLEILPIDA